jgi:hypothetical protein
MKPIPQELQAYFPNADNPARPWWRLYDSSMLGQKECAWFRKDGRQALINDDLAVHDNLCPALAPPILVGQVWATRCSHGGWRVATITSTHIRPDGDHLAWWCNNGNGPDDWTWLHRRGFLLSCPYGYAPWSGPEVAP